MANFSVEVEHAPVGLVLHLRGVIDAHTSGDFEKALIGLLQGGHRKAVLDFEGVDYVSSAGFGVLLSAINNFRIEGADIKVAAMGESIKRVFNMLGFHRVLEMCPSVAAALSRFGAPAAAAADPEPSV